MLELAPFADLRDLLTLKNEEVDDYPALAVLVRSVYSAFESFLGRTLERGTYTETVICDGRQILLAAIPVVSISSAVDADANQFAVDGQFSPRPYGAWSVTPLTGSVTFTYVGGLVTAPADIARAAMLQIAHEWQRKDQLGSTSVSNEGGSVQWPELGLLKEVKRLLAPHVSMRAMGI